MSEPLLFVPFGENQNFSLYKVFFKDDYPELCWSIPTMFGVSEEMRDKVENLQEYFEQRHYKKEIRGSFQGINISDRSFFTKITPSTPSVFLGLFLAAVIKIQQRKIKSTWSTITVTGNLDYDKNSGEMNLINVEDIDLKFKAVKAYADEHTEGRHLFVYINSDEKVPEGTKGNIKVKRFSPESSIFDVMNFVFEHYIPDMEIRDIDDTQRRLLTNKQNFYISTAEFEKNQEEIFKKNWSGFFIYGEGASGKSAMAQAMVRYMMWTRRIYAPLWIDQNSTEYQQGEIREAQITKDDITSIICNQLHIKPVNENALAAEFSEKQYLIVFDNIFNVTLNTLLKAIDAFIDPFYKNRPLLIIISINYPDKDTLPDNLRNLMTIKPPELPQNEVKELINYQAKQNGYLDIIEAIKDPEEYDIFLSEIVKRFGRTPGHISPAASMLRRRTVNEALASLKSIKDKSLQENIIAIYKPLFDNLSENEQIVLFLILNCIEPDTPKSKEEIFDKLLSKHYIIKNEKISNEGIGDSLDMLLDYHFIYRTEEAGITKYAIKSHYFLVFAFHPEFAGEYDSEKGKYLRELIMINYKWSLHIALRYDQSSEYVINILKLHKKDKVIKEFKQSYLFTAARYSSSAENLKLLKKYLKVKINVPDEDGETAFLRAAGYNPNPEITEWFLNNLNKKAILRKDNDGFNALWYAVLFDAKLEIIKKLIDSGHFNPHEHIKTGLAAGRTLFLLALEGNTNLKICEYFIDELKCDINELFYIDIRKFINNTLIDENLDKEDGEQANLLGLRELIRNNQEEKEVKKQLKKNPHSPVMFALLNPNTKILEKIVSSPRFDPEVVLSTTGTSLLHIAAKIVSRPESLDLLKRHGYDNINEHDKFGLTPFHYTAMNNRSIPIFNWFVDNGADIHEISDEGVAAFGYAVIYNTHPGVIEWFIEQGIDLNLKDKHGIPPLHYAVGRNPNPEIYQYLIKNGADINAQDIDGETPLQYARAFKQKDRVKWLKQHGAIT
jgi:ankyrin repeat protein